MTDIDDKTNELLPFRAFGLEYYNICSVLWSRLSRSNMDIQFLINSEGRSVTCYTLKYTFKPQHLESSFVMKMGLLTRSVGRVVNRADNANIEPMERGKRIINAVLYAFTKPVEVPATIAALVMIRGGLFIMSHNPVYVNLELAAACYRDEKRYYTDEDEDDDDDDEDDLDYIPGEESTSEDDEDDEEDEDEEWDDLHEIENGGDDDNDVDNDDDDQVGVDEDDDGVVNLSIQKRSLRYNSQEEGNECDKYIDFNLMNDYWYRPEALKTVSYIELLEQYNLQSGEGPHFARMCDGHPNKTLNHWRVNTNYVRRCAVVMGKQMPNLHSKNLTVKDQEFYYKCLLLLFKPHTFDDNKLIRTKGMDILFIY